MRAVIYTGAGGPEVIRIGEVPKPEVRPEHIRVRVHAAGLNRADLIQRRGQYAAPPGWPADIPGMEYAGEVEAVRGTSKWKVGDRVMGLVGGGAQAELVTVHQDETLPIPPGLSYPEAAAIPEVFLTAYDALVTRGRLASGERVLIHAVGSGLGTAAAQIAKHLGATVVGTSRSADKLARATIYGLDAGIDTSQSGFRDAVGDPVNVILDVLGGPAFADNLHVLAPRGRLVMLGFLAGSRTTADLGPILRKRLEVIGTMMRIRGLEERAPLVREFTERMLPLFDHRIEHSTPLRPVLERTYPMTELAEAHRALEANETFGKVVVAWDP
jgi:putative PIG3 family NAD(P)H quinone oxidoreductase